MTKLCDHTEVGLGLKSIQHLYYVLMPQIPQNLYFLPQISDVLLAFAMLHDELHGSDLTSEFSTAFIYLQRTKGQECQLK